MDEDQKMNTEQPAIPTTIRIGGIEVNDAISVERYSDGFAFIVSEDGGITSIGPSVPYSAGKEREIN